MMRKSSTTSTAAPPVAPLTDEETALYNALCAAAADLATPAQKKRLADPHATQNGMALASRAGVADASTVARAMRYIVLRAQGATHRRAAKSVGIDWATLQLYRWSNPQYAVVADFVQTQYMDMLRTKAEDVLSDMLDGAPPPKDTSRAVMFALERLGGKFFAPPSHNTTGDNAAARLSAGGVTYNITFMGGASAPNLCGQCVGNSPDPAIIDIK